MAEPNSFETVTQRSVLKVRWVANHSLIIIVKVDMVNLLMINISQSRLGVLGGAGALAVRPAKVAQGTGKGDVSMAIFVKEATYKHNTATLTYPVHLLVS